MEENIFKIKSINVKDKDNLVDCYELLEAHQKLDIFMYTDTSLQTFLDKYSKAWVYLCVLDDEIVGFTAFDSFQGKSAFFHFCMFNGGEPFVLDFGRMIFETVFRNDDLLTVFGLTPTVYRHVFPTLEAIGFEKLQTIIKVCEMKNKLRDGLLSSLTKDNFYKVNKEYM